LPVDEMTMTLGVFRYNNVRYKKYFLVSNVSPPNALDLHDAFLQKKARSSGASGKDVGATTQSTIVRRGRGTFSYKG
jgi:hypothetical protein